MKEIKQFREKLDEIDIEILELLMERMDIVKRIGLIKKRQNLSIIDKNREEEVYDNATKFAFFIHGCQIRQYNEPEIAMIRVFVL